MWISIAQVVISIILIILILLQERTSGLSGVLGGDSGSSFYQTRRGLEKIVFISTIVFTVAFAALALLDHVF